METHHETTGTTVDSLVITQMPEIGWIDALRRYNLGGSSWCIPRKGTPEYDKVMAIRRGETDVKPKPRRRIIKAHVPIEKDASPNRIEHAQQEPEPAPSRMKEIEEQIKEELAKDEVSVSYDLGWKPDTDEKVTSGGSRQNQVLRYASLLPSTELRNTLDLARLKALHDNVRANELLTDIRNWKPQNVYYGRGHVYNTKTAKGMTESAKKALEDYQEFADKVNAIRGSPIRNISYRSVYHPDGSRTMEAYWPIHRETFEHLYFVRKYQLQPEFKFLGGSTLGDVEKEMEEERRKDEEAKKKAEDKAKDPLVLLKKKYEDLGHELRKMPFVNEDYEAIFERRQAVEKEIKAMEKERKAARESTEEGQKIKALQAEKKDLEKQQNKLTYLGPEFKAMGKRIDKINEEIKVLRKRK